MDGDSIAKNSVDGVARADNGPRAFTIPEAAQKLSLGKSTVWALVAKNEIKSFKIGRLRRIRPEALEEFINRQATASQEHVA